MAGRIMHELAFRLNAQRSSGFDSAFSGARSIVAGMQAELQRLNQAQRDITGYQRQQQQVQRTEQRLTNLRAQYDLIQREIAETNGSTAGLERESLRLQERINSTNEALGRQRQRLQQTSQALREAGVDTENLTVESIRLAEESRDLQEAQEQAAAGAESFGSRAAGAFDAAGQALVAAGIYGGLQKVASGFNECLNLAGEFEHGMSDVAALSGADERAVNVLADKAKELGGSTKFTAAESTQAMGYMAMAGWDEQDMVAGIDGVLQLAAASGEDLALTSDIITDNLSAFHLTAADTDRFADVLAAAATNANTNVAVMGETFKDSASVAGALGYSIEDVAVAVGLMANSGIKGSRAGTSMKNSFNGLLEGVTLSGAAFGEYEYSAVQADGTMKSLGNTIRELRGYFKQMTEAERVANAINIAGKEGYNGLLAILLSADDDYNKLTDSINNCSGAAERMAQIRLDNLQGDITLAESAADALKISVGEQFLPVMRKVYQEGTELLGLTNDFVQQNPAVVKAGGAFIGTLGGLAAGVTGVSAAVRIFQALNAAAIFAGPVGPILGLSAALAAVVGGVVALREGAFDAAPSLRELTAAARDMEKAMQDADAVFKDSESQTLAMADVAGHYIDKLEQMGDGEKLGGEARQEYLNTLELLCRTMPELSDIIDTETGKIEGGTAALRENTKAWQENALAQARQKHLESYQDAVVAAEFETAENTIKLTEARDRRQTYEEQAAAIQAELDRKVAEAQKQADEHNVLYRGSEISSDLLSAEDILVADSEYVQRQQELAALQRQAKSAAREEARYTKAVDEGQAAVAEATLKLDSMRAALDQLGETEAEQAAYGVAALDQSAQAAESARATIQAYIDGILAMLPQVKGAFNVLGGLLPKQNMLFSTAINAAVGNVLPGVINLPAGGAYAPAQGDIKVKNAYAGGTDNAAAGWALVGEQGPELLFMQGGERILTNRETEHILQRDTLTMQQAAALPEPARALPNRESNGGVDAERIQITVAPDYHISGNALPEELREVLQRHDEDLREWIEEILNNRQIERRRRAFIQ